MTPLTVPPWAILLAVLLVVIAVYAVSNRPKRNRRWPSDGQSHHSYWSSARRVDE